MCQITAEGAMAGLIFCPNMRKCGTKKVEISVGFTTFYKLFKLGKI